MHIIGTSPSGNPLIVPDGTTWQEEAQDMLASAPSSDATIEDILMSAGWENIDWTKTSPRQTAPSRGVDLDVHIKYPWLCPHITMEYVRRHFAIMLFQPSGGIPRTVHIVIPSRGPFPQEYDHFTAAISTEIDHTLLTASDPSLSIVLATE